MALHHPSLRLRYGADPTRLDAELVARFVPLTLDAETRRFIEDAELARLGRWRGAAHALLRRFASDFDVNAWLHSYPLFLLSAGQWTTLLGAHQRGALLDVGAGAGDVSRALGRGFSRHLAVETSGPMVKRLRERGLEALKAELSEEPVPTGPWDVIALLNVLDRCARPRTLLGRLRAALPPSGRLLLSLPLPYRPHWYDGGRTLEPLEPLAIGERRFEAALQQLALELARAGLRVERWTRAPYLSAGDGQQAVYELDAAVLLCEPERAP